MKLLIFTIIILSVCFNATFCGPYHFVFVITSYNNILWYKQNLDSMVAQDYTDWIAYYIDDCSTDGTGQAVQQYIREHQLEHKIIYMGNKQRMRKMRNVYNVIMQCPDDAIIIIYDGDDYLAHGKVLSRIKKEYKNPRTWVTYGTYVDDEVGGIKWISHGEKLDEFIIKKHMFRKEPYVYRYVPGHPFTFYAWLFKKIKYEDFLINGEFVPAGSDIVLLPPIMEMAARHFVYIPDVLYIHNCRTVLNDHKVNGRQQGEVTAAALKKTPYTPLA